MFYFLNSDACFMRLFTIENVRELPIRKLSSGLFSKMQYWLLVNIHVLGYSKDVFFNLIQVILGSKNLIRFGSTRLRIGQLAKPTEPFASL